MWHKLLFFASVATLGLVALSVRSDPVQSGASLYHEYCAACHGADLEGQPNWRSPNPDGTLPAPPHDESGHTWHHGDRLLFDYVKLGGAEAMAARGASGFKSAMPGFAESLTEEDIWDILTFLKSHWSQRARAYQEQVTANEQ